MAAAGGAGGDKVYVDDVFGTFLYEGDTSATSRKLTTGLDFDDKGGLAWFKRREDQGDGVIFDTVRSGLKYLVPSSSSGEQAQGSPADLISFNSDGVNIGQNNPTNDNNKDIVLWQFLKQPGFFDIQTYTGNNTGQTLTHDLECVPAMILIKRTDFGDDWIVYHVGSDSSAPEDYSLKLNETDARSNNDGAFNDTAPTSTHFTVGNSGAVSQGGKSFVAYLFAGTNDSDSQIFGDASDEAIIKCGSYTGGTDGSVFVDLGFEPQFLILKKINGSSHWAMIDTMRGLNANQGVSPPTRINANESDAENTTGLNGAYVAANGFYPWGNGGGDWNDPNGTYIYIAIRRPMKTPESGTEVFTPNSYSGNSTADRTLVSSNSPVDLGIVKKFNGNGDWLWSDRLRGAGQTLYSNYTQAESVANPPVYITGFDLEDGMEVGSHLAVNASGNNYISYMFTRAAGFFDVVAYTGNSTGNTAITHNLGVVPEIIITKPRNGADNWAFWHKDFTQSQVTLLHNTLGVVTNSNYWGSSTPTATNFYVQTDGATNYSGYTYIAYLFATVAGVSKVGSYTGTGSDINVDCGFTSGARFILIKRTDSTGDWYTYDSERGIVAGNDPYVLINSQSGEVTSTDYIDPLSSGFTVTSSAPAALNASGGTYIFLAIA